MRASQERSQPRFDVEGVDGSFLVSADVDVQNLSIAGMAVETSQCLAVGRRYVFTLRIGDDSVRIGGRIAWCVLGRGRRDEMGEMSPVYHAGVKFENMLSAHAEKLVNLLEKTAVLDVNNRIFGRFHLASRKAASVDAGIDFDVRRISQGGLLAEIRGEGRVSIGVGTCVPLEFGVGETSVEIDGKIAWVGNDTPGKTSIGIEFVDVQDEARKALDAYISTIVAQSEPQRA